MKFNKLHKVKNYNKEIYKAKIIKTDGSVPREIGDFMLITIEDIFGSIGGGYLEFIIINKAKNFLKKKIKTNEKLNIPLGPGIGQCCGGYVQILLSHHLNGKESIEKEEFNYKVDDNLFIFGAGHIGQALSSISTDLNFNVHLVDSRKNFLFMNEYKNIDYIFAEKPWHFIKS